MTQAVENHPLVENAPSHAQMQWLLIALRRNKLTRKCQEYV